MKTPTFLLEWINSLPYHQISELTLWMDRQENVQAAIEQVIGESLNAESNYCHEHGVWSPCQFLHE